MKLSFFVFLSLCFINADNHLTHPYIFRFNFGATNERDNACSETNYFYFKFI